MRTPCCVPHCQRTIAREKLEEGYDDRAHYEWICQKHIVLVPKIRRRSYARAKKRLGINHPLVGRLWASIKRYAIERAMGI